MQGLVRGLPSTGAPQAAGARAILPSCSSSWHLRVALLAAFIVSCTTKCYLVVDTAHGTATNFRAYGCWVPQMRRHMLVS